MSLSEIVQITANRAPFSSPTQRAIKRTGRKMDEAWKKAISEGLKASGKIGHTAVKVGNTAKVGGALTAMAAPVVGGAVGGAVKGAVGGVKLGIKTKASVGNTVKGAKIGGAGGAFYGAAKGLNTANKVKNKIGLKSTTLKNSYFNK